MSAIGTSGMLDRMLGVMRLDPHVFEEIEADREATNQAFMVVVLAGVAGGVGQVREDAAAVTAGITSNLGGWSLFAFLAWIIGSRLFGTPETSASWSELARTLGFAYTPMLLSATGLIPVLGEIAFAIGSIWFVAASVIAMRQALDFTTARAIGTGIACRIAQILLALVVFAILGATLPTE